MRRIIPFGLVLALVICLGAAPASARAERRVNGSLSGPGGFQFESNCGTIAEVGRGEYRAKHLGHGTYDFHVCVTVGGVISFDGTIAFTTKRGAVLNGTISGQFTGGTGPAFEVQITGGTKRFANATGQLVVGPLVETDMTNCDPRVGICLNWVDTGPITGTIVRHRH